MACRVPWRGFLGSAAAVFVLAVGAAPAFGHVPSELLGSSHWTSAGKAAGNLCQDVANDCAYADGPFATTTLENCFSSPSATSPEYSEIGYWQGTGFPKTGDHYYGHVLITNTSNPCIGGDYDYVSIGLPPGTHFDMNNPEDPNGQTHCFYSYYDSGGHYHSGELSDCTNANAGWSTTSFNGCSSNCFAYHTDPNGSLSGALATPSYGTTELVFPITSTQPLSSPTKILGRTQSAGGDPQDNYYEDIIEVGQGPKADSSITISGGTTAKKVKVNGSVAPNRRGERVSVELFKKSNGSFRHADSKSDTLDTSSKYSVSFARQHGKCKITASYGGDSATRGATNTSNPFAC